MATKPITNESVVKHTLSNGLTVLTKEVHVAPVVACYVWYKVGARNERPGITGISHWVEHMLFKGTPKFPKEELKRQIERHGGRWNGFTNTDYTAYFEVLPADKIAFALEMEADRMQNSVVDENEVAVERTVILSEREGAENHPQFLLREEVQAAAYKAHPYQWGVIGWKSDLQSITRDDLYTYYRTYYVPNNAVLVVVGDFDTEEIMADIRRYFEKIPAGDAVLEPRTIEPPQNGERRVIVRKEGNIAHVDIAYHIPAIGDTDIYPLDVLQRVLSYGRSSRIYKELVDTELATSANLFIRGTKDPGLAWMSAEVRDGIKPEDVEQAFLPTIENVQSELVSDAELKKAINQAEAGFVYAQDSVSNQAGQLGYYESIYSHTLLDEYLNNIRNVTKADVQRVAQQYFVADNRTVGYFIPIPPTGANTSAGSPAPSNGGEFYYCANSEDGMQKSTKSIFAQNGRSPAREILDNGLVVIVQENHAIPVVSISGRLKAGGMYDTDEYAGCADFVASMLTRGTTTRTWQQIAEETESVGASVGVGGGTELVRFSARSLSKDFNLVLDVLSDVLRNPNFPTEEIDKHRNQVLSWFKAWDDDPAQVAERELRALLYPTGHPHHRRLQGYEDTITKLEREHLCDFHAQYYRPDATIIAVVGNIDTETAIAKVTEAFGDWQGTGEPPAFVIPTAEMQEPSRKIISMMDKSQVEVFLGHIGISRTNPDFYAVDVMNRILGGSAGIGRLFNYVRDVQGLAYGVWSRFSAGLGEGPFIARAGVNPKNVERAVQSILDEITRLKEDGITEQELADAQDMLVGTFALSMETNGGIANVLLDAEVFGLGLDYPQQHEQLYRAVTKEQAGNAARKYLHPERCTLVIAGPYTESTQ